LGIRMATIQSSLDGSPCFHVDSHAQGVGISGLSLAASTVSNYEGYTFFQWRDNIQEMDFGDDIAASRVNNPGSIHDLFSMVAGRSLYRNVYIETMHSFQSRHWK
jgi:hypothetical protein